jgi:S-(hydroxymethyl)glutathione synthase
MTETKLHPLIDDGLVAGSPAFAGGTLVCACTDRPVEVQITGPIAHNHACGCTQCWKPEGAAFSIVAVVPHAAVTVTANGDKLKVVNPDALIQRHACTSCGVHMYGPVERDHAFKGLDFIHPERFTLTGAPPPGFAAFVSSVIEGGVPPAQLDGIRQRLKAVDLVPYDCLNPPLMDALATFAARKAGTLRE